MVSFTSNDFLSGTLWTKVTTKETREMLVETRRKDLKTLVTFEIYSTQTNDLSP